MRRTAAILLASMALGACGCSTLNPWDGDYGCRGYPEGVNCKSAREVYELTNYRDSLTKDQGEDCVECDRQDGLQLKPAQYVSPDAAAATAAVQGLGYAGPMPLRSAAKIMRVWIAPWESMDGALHLPTYLYAEVVERRWSIGEKRMEVAPRITPLEPRAVPAPPERGQRPAARPPAAKGAKGGPDAAPAPPRENPHPAPTLDLSPKSKNAPKNVYFDSLTRRPQGHN